MTKFAVYEKVSELAYRTLDKSKMSDLQQTSVNLGSGLIAGFAAAIVSQPADTMLSKINKTKGLPGEGTASRLIKIGRELGLRGSFTGIGARLFMVGGLTAGQFAIYGDIKKVCGLHNSSQWRTAYIKPGIGRDWRCGNCEVDTALQTLERDTITTKPVDPKTYRDGFTFGLIVDRFSGLHPLQRQQLNPVPLHWSLLVDLQRYEVKIGVRFVKRTYERLQIVFVST